MVMDRGLFEYRYPDECCGNCEHSFADNDKGLRCKQWETDDRVCIGGVCRLYEKTVPED